MLMSRRSAYVTIVVTALATYAFAAYASLWRAPQGLGQGVPEAYASFHDGSIFGIQLFTAIWTLWASGCAVFVLVNLRLSDAWVRGGRHRFISLAGSILMTYGLIGIASWMPCLEVDLAMEHVIPSPQRDGSASMLFQFVWVTAACAIIAALILGAAGAAIDRMIGKAPLLVAA
jgi:hypothetical protein